MQLRSLQMWVPFSIKSCPWQLLGLCKIVEKRHYIPVLSCLFSNFAMHEFGPEAKRDNKQNVTE